MISKFLTFSWLGTITGIAGGILLALNIANYSKFGFIFFLVSASSWLIQGYKNKDFPLVLLNCVFVIVDILGIYNWIILDNIILN